MNRGTFMHRNLLQKQLAACVIASGPAKECLCALRVEIIHLAWDAGELEPARSHWASRYVNAARPFHVERPQSTHGRVHDTFFFVVSCGPAAAAAAPPCANDSDSERRRRQWGFLRAAAAPG